MVAQPAPIDPRAFVVVANEAARRVRVRAEAQTMSDDWESWLRLVFGGYVSRGFAPFHADFWRWVWAIEAGQRTRPFVGIWPRGFAKSTSAELSCAAVAARKSRRYALYISETQEQADDHVANVAGMLESRIFELAYPEAAARRMGKYGNSRGWRRNRLRTASGFTLDAIGLDTAARGVKLDEDRPDLLIFDDLDGKLDTAATTEKKLTTLTHTLLPAASDAPAVLAIQNLVIPDGIFARLADGRADFLADRIISGPHPAIRNLTLEQRDGRTVVTGGDPTWPAMGLDVAQAQIDEMGATAYRAEKQHDVEAPVGGMFDHLVFRHCRWSELPDLVRIVVWVDPAVTDTDQSDAHGIQADGLGPDGTIYRLFSWEDRTSPKDSLQRAILKAVELKADTVGVETDQGGDTWATTYEAVVRDLVAGDRITAREAPAFQQDKAGSGHGPKVHRASQMLADYERGLMVHVVGTHETLERALRRFPKTKPLDLVDACLVAGSLVETARGMVPIEEIRVGDYAMTRRGWRPVVAAGMTRASAPVVRVTCADGSTLTGTENHPIFTVERGWLPMSEAAGLSAIIRPCAIPSIPSKLNIEGESIAVTRKASSERIGSITSRLGRVRASARRCIVRFGSITTGLFHQGTKSIMTMEIPSTMTLATSCVSPCKSIGTQIERRHFLTPMRVASIWPQFANALPSGIEAMRGGLGIENTASRHGRGASQASSLVASVARRFSLALQPDQDIAPRRAETAPLSTIHATSLMPRANSVAGHSPHLAIDRDGFVRSRVETVTSAGAADVYNLTVDGDPEYFANGILVHNCYWAWNDLRENDGSWVA